MTFSLRQRLKRHKLQENSNNNQEILEKEEITIEVRQIFQTTLNACERLILNSMPKNTSVTTGSKKLFIASLFQARILIARLLALYRWKISAYRLSKSNDEEGFNNLLSTSIEFLRNINNLIFSSNKPSSKNITSKRSIQNEKIKCLPDDCLSIFIPLFLGIVPSSITGCKHHKNIISITFLDFAIITIKVNNNFHFRFQSLNLFTDISTDANFKEALKQFCSKLKEVVSSTPAEIMLRELDVLFKDFDSFIQQFKLIQTLTQKCDTRKNIHFEENDGNLCLVLPQNFSPYDRYYVRYARNSLFLCTNIPFFDESSGSFSLISDKIESFSKEYLENTVSRLFHISYQSKLKILMAILKKHLHDFDPVLCVDCPGNKISFSLNETEILSVAFDDRDFSAHIEQSFGLFVSAKQFLNAIESSESVCRLFFRTLIERYSLSYIFSNSCSAPFWQNWTVDAYLSGFTPLVSFSSCSSFHFVLKNAFSQRPVLDLLLDKEDQRNFWAFVDPLSPKQAAIALEVFKTGSVEHRSVAKQVKRIATPFSTNVSGFPLADIRNGCVIFGKTIRFSPDSQSNVSFRITENLNWTLEVYLNDYDDVSYIISGCETTANMVLMVKQYGLIIARFLHLRSQALNVSGACVSDSHRGSLRIQYMKEYVPSFVITLSGVSPLCESKTAIRFAKSQNANIDLNLSFSRFSKVSAYLNALIHSNKSFLRFGSFITSALTQLSVLQDVFRDDRKNAWCVTALSDETSFYLIYQKRFTMNIMWKSTHVFQLIIPMISLSLVLQIALMKFPNFNVQSRLSHPTVRLQTSKLSELKANIEEFFSDRDALLKAKFYPEQKENEKMPIFKTNTKSDWLNFSVTMGTNGLEIKLLNNNATAERVVRAFDVFSFSREAMRCRLIFLAVLSEKDEEVGKAVARAVESTAKIPGIDWLLFVKRASFVSEPVATMKFSQVQTSYGNFSLEVKLTYGGPTVKVVSDIAGATRVTNFSTYESWINSLINTYGNNMSFMSAFD